MLPIYRILSLIAISFSVIFMVKNYNKIVINTDLQGLSPKVAKEADIQHAMNTLSESIESRFFLIITSPHKQHVADAASELKAALEKIDKIILSKINTTNAFVEGFKKHRFQLLSPKQQEQLKTQSEATLIEQVKRHLFRIDASLQLLPFTEDPFATFNNYIVDILSQNPFNINDIQEINYNKKNIFFQTIPIILTKGTMGMHAKETLYSDIDYLDNVLSERYKVDILRSGLFFFAADTAKKSKMDIQLISTLSSIGIAALLLFVFRSILALALPFISIIIGLVFAVSINHLLYGSIHILTIVFGASLIGIIIDYSLHYFYHLIANSVHLLNKLYRAMLLSLITSIVGYGALSFSGLDTLKKVAVFSCCGICAAWLSVVAIGSNFSIKPARNSDEILGHIILWFDKGINCATKKLTFSLWGILLIAILITLYFIKVPTSDNPKFFFHASIDLLDQERQAGVFFTDFEPSRYLIIQGNSTAAIYDDYTALLNFLDETDKKYLFSVAQLVPSPSQQKQNYTLQGKLYQETGIVSQLFDQLGLSAELALKLTKEYQARNESLATPALLTNAIDGIPPIWIENKRIENKEIKNKEVKNKEIENNNSIISFILIKKGSDITSIKEASYKIDNVTFIDSLELSQNSLADQRLSASILLILACLFIAILTLIYYKALKALWILLVPLTSIIGTLLIYTIFDIHVTLFTIMGLFLVLGLGMDYVIFFKEMGDNNALTTESAVLLSAITTLLSFGLLTLSTIPVAQAFGATLLVGNTINFVAAFTYKNIRLNKSVEL